MDITEIVKIIFWLIVSAVSVFAIPYIKSKMTKEQMDDFLKWVEIGVMAAEQLFDSVDGKAKKEHVLQFLLSKGYTVDSAVIDAAVEAAVLRLHRELLSGYKTGREENDVGGDGND